MPDWIAIVLVVAVLVIIWQLARIGSFLSSLAATLNSLDSEVFHLAQEQNPSYGQCHLCGRRAAVRLVIPKEPLAQSEPPEQSFYCHACYWMSDTVVLGDANVHYKDRLSARDRLAARVGPT